MGKAKIFSKTYSSKGNTALIQALFQAIPYELDDSSAGLFFEGLSLFVILPFVKS